MNIGKFSADNGVLVNIAIVSLLVLGIFSIQRLPKEQFSEVPFFWVNITVPYIGVSAEDIEKSVTIPVENEMQGIDRLKRIQSVSAEGLSLIRVEFDDSVDEDEFARLYQEVRTRFSRAELPDGILPAVIDDFSSSDFLPVIEVIVSGEAGYSEIVKQAENLSSRISTIANVSGIDSIGSRDRQILIEADRIKMESLGISISEIINTVNLQNVTVPAGTVETPNREYLLRTVGGFENVGDFGNIIVRRGTASSGIVRVRDLASIESSFEKKGVYSSFNGKEAVVLRISKVPGGNSVRVVKGVKEELASFRKTLPPGIDVTLSGDSTVQINKSIQILINNAAIGMILLTVILYLFIGLRNALMTALGIPVAFAITFLILEASGETFNTNTLFGMVLVLGLIVDHAIVIIENSYQLRQQGLPLYDSAVKGTNQVILPVAAATATTIAAFLPLMIIPGTIGKFLRVIPFTVSVALAASTFEALFFLPSHFADWPENNKRVKNNERFSSFQNKFRRLLVHLYGKKKRVIFSVLFFMIAVFATVPFLKQDLFAAEDYTLFNIDIKMAPGTSIDRTKQTVSEFVEKILPFIGKGEVVSVTSHVGFTSGGDGSSAASNIAQITVDLAESDEGRTRSISGIMLDIKELTSEIPGPEEVLFRKAVNGPPSDPPVSFRISGNDYRNLAEVSELIINKLSSYPELLNIRDDLETGSPELKVRINPERASALGLDPYLLGSFLRDIFTGRTATAFFSKNEEIEVLVRYASEEGYSPGSIDQLIIPLPDGRQIPFSSIAYIESGESLTGIKRVDGTREITIAAEAYVKDNVRKVNSDIEQYFNSEIAPFYPDVQLNVGGEFAELDNLLIQILRVFLIGVFLIYLILGTQFKSYIQPFLILLTVPFAFTGIVIYLLISGTPFSTTVLYAGVALAGIAVNDSIVLVSLINELRSEGMGVAEAVAEAAGTRLRPIILTSLTTIAGLVPTAAGLGGRSVVWSPMASTIIFGLVFSTLTALFIIPLLYGILFDRKQS